MIAELVAITRRKRYTQQVEVTDDYPEALEAICLAATRRVARADRMRDGDKAEFRLLGSDGATMHVMHYTHMHGE